MSLFLFILLVGLLFDSAVQDLAKHPSAEAVISTWEYVSRIGYHMGMHLIDLPNCILGSAKIATVNIKVNRLIIRKLNQKGENHGNQ